MSILNFTALETELNFCTEMVERHADLETTRQTVLLCRLKLGAVLHRLEKPIEPDALNLIRDRVDEVENEIRLLINTMQRVMGG